MRLAKGRASGSPNPPASSAGVNPRGSSISASGLPRASPRIRALTRSSSGPGIVVSSSSRASSAASPSIDELRQPLEDVLVAGLAQREHQRRPAPPGAGAPRTPASARTPGRATARRRRCTAAAAPRRRRPAGSGPPARRGSDPAAVRRSGRTPCSARRAAGPAAARDGRASARTAHAGRRTRAPSRTRRPPPGRSGIPRRPSTGAATGRSCRPPPRRAGPAPGSGPHALPRRVAPARRARRHGRATPTMTGSRRPCWRIIARPAHGLQDFYAPLSRAN